MNDPTTDESLERLKDSYLEVHAPASIAAAAGEQFAASQQPSAWRPGWVLASLLLAVVLIPVATNRSTDGAGSASLTLPTRDFAFPSLSAIDLPPPRIFSIQRPSATIEALRLTPIPPIDTNDEAYL